MFADLLKVQMKSVVSDSVDATSVNKKNFFGWHIQSHCLKEQDPDRNRNSVVQIRIRTNTRKTVVITANLTLFRLALVPNDVKIFINFFMYFRYVQWSCWQLFQRWKTYSTKTVDHSSYSDPDSDPIFRGTIRIRESGTKMSGIPYTVVPMEHIFFSVLRPICLVCSLRVWGLLY
jgi:hypothetical protein